MSAAVGYDAYPVKNPDHSSPSCYPNIAPSSSRNPSRSRSSNYGVADRLRHQLVATESSCVVSTLSASDNADFLTV